MLNRFNDDKVADSIVMLDSHRIAAVAADDVQVVHPPQLQPVHDLLDVGAAPRRALPRFIRGREPVQALIPAEEAVRVRGQVLHELRQAIVSLLYNVQRSETMCASGYGPGCVGRN